MKVVLVINSMGQGGAERVLVTLARAWAARGVEVSIVALASAEQPYEIPPSVNYITLSQRDRGGVRGLLNLPLQIWRLRKLLHAHTPDAVVSFLPRANYALGLLRYRASNGLCILSERNITTSTYPNGTLKGLVGRWLVRQVYSRADRVICISDGVRASLEEIGVRARVPVVHNPQDLDMVRELAKEEMPDGIWRKDAGEVFRVVSVGSLNSKKGYPVLIEALSKLKGKVPVECVVLGEGPERGALEDCIRTQGMTECISLVGHYKNPFPVVKSAELFVSASLWEGFGNVIVEAMALGTAVLVTDCPGGPKDIVANGRYGMLARTNDASDLAGKIYELATNKDELEKYARLAGQRAETFDAEQIINQYEQVMGISSSLPRRSMG